VSEVYWVWGGEITGAPDLASRMQEQASIRPTWIEELHWLAAPPAQPGIPGADFSANLPFFLWEMPGMQDHYLLQSVGRTVTLEQRGLVVIVEEQQGKLAALALASPRAVGRYNLLPHSRLIFLPSVQLSIVPEHPLPEQAAARLLEPVQLALDQVTWLAGSAKRASGGAVPIVNKLVKKLDGAKANYALLVSLIPAGLAHGTLLERI